MTPRRDRRRAEAAGRRSERLAALVLRAKGFSIIARRYKAPVGEIDLIARRGRLLAFVEVKARARLDDAAGAVTHTARRRIGAAAAAFLARHPHLAQSDMRYDIFAVAGWRWRHIASAWREGD
jgi:putative endonuclease